MSRPTPKLTCSGHGPGKILLFGEHAVVYGQPAIGLPLSRGVGVTLQAGAGGLRCRLRPGLRAVPSSAAATPEMLVQAVLGAERPQLDVEIHFEVPPMAGFGTSAALSVALLRAHDAWRRASGRPVPKLSHYRRALSVEAVAHGRPSGVDPATCLASGLIQFERPGPRPKLQALSVGAPTFLLVGTAGAHGGARQSISRLSAWRTEAPELVEASMAALGATSRAGAKALTEGDPAALGAAFDLAHGILTGLGLVGPKVAATCQRLRELGAHGAKMSGAGGAGGAYVAVFGRRAEAERAARRVGGWVEVITPPKAARSRGSSRRRGP